MQLGACFKHQTSNGRIHDSINDDKNKTKRLLKEIWRISNIKWQQPLMASVMNKARQSLMKEIGINYKILGGRKGKPRVEIAFTHPSNPQPIPVAIGSPKPLIFNSNGHLLIYSAIQLTFHIDDGGSLH